MPANSSENATLRIVRAQRSFDQRAALQRIGGVSRAGATEAPNGPNGGAQRTLTLGWALNDAPARLITRLS